MRIVDPTHGVPAESSDSGSGPQQASSRVTDWTAATFGLLSNAKPNANELLQGIANRLQSAGAVTGSELVAKPNSATPAPETTIDYLAERHRLVLVGTGD